MPDDRYRPTYHFMPPSGWMNDPNGPITWRDGTHHLFYQHNPLGGWHEKMHWGHAISKDLVHWEHRPIALAPDQEFDKDGVYSGSAIDADGVAAIFYTGIRPEVQCMAIATDESLDTWKKLEEPIVPHRPDHLQLDGFRDPTLWIDPETKVWNMGIGSGIIDRGGIVLRYEALDGLYSRWRYAGVLLQNEPSLAVNCECPDYFQLKDRWVMLASPQAESPRRGAGTVWLTGKHQNGEFIPEKQGILDASPLYYAPKSFMHHSQRRVLWGWIREGRSVSRQHNLPWAGVMSLPRDIALDSDGVVVTNPSPEVKGLRQESIFRLQEHRIHEGESTIIAESGMSIEIEVTIQRGTAKQVEIWLLADADGREKASVTYDWETETLSLDQSESTIDSDCEINRSIYTAGQNPDIPNRDGQFSLAKDEPLRLRIFVDHSVIELFANERTAITGRAYPVKPDSSIARIVSLGGDLNIVELEAWQMKNIWE